jgi:hypothetical protein
LSKEGNAMLVQGISAVQSVGAVVLDTAFESQATVLVLRGRTPLRMFCRLVLGKRQCNIGWQKKAMVLINGSQECKR